MALYEISFIINDGEMVMFRVEAASRQGAIALALEMLLPGDVVHDVCVERYFGRAA